MEEEPRLSLKKIRFYLPMKSILVRTILKHRLTFFSLILILLLGYFIRAKFAFDSPYITYFSSDDAGHSVRSGILENGARSFTELLEGSHSDAHPILRNLALNLILRFSNNIYDIRWVSMIPEILLILLSFFFTKTICFNISKNLKHSNLIALIISCFYAFSFIHIELSTETRPYPLMLIFQISSLISLLSFNRFKKNYQLLLFYIFCSLAIITDYSALIPVATLALATIVISWNEKFQMSYRMIVLLGSILLVSITGFHFFHMCNTSSSDPTKTILEQNTNLEHITKTYIKNFQDFEISLHETFGSFFISPDRRNNSDGETFILAMGILYWLGLLYLISIRSYLLLFLALFPMILGVVLSYLKLFPFAGGRHCIYFFSHILISYIAVFSFLLNHKNWFITKVIFTLLVFGFFYCSGIYNSSSIYLTFFTKKTDFYKMTPIKEDVFNNIINLITNERYEDYYIAIPEHLHNHLKIFLIFSKFKTRDNKPELLIEQEDLLLNAGRIISCRIMDGKIIYNKENLLPTGEPDKVLIITLSDKYRNYLIEDLKDKGYDKIIVNTFYQDWTYDELQRD